MDFSPGSLSAKMVSRNRANNNNNNNVPSRQFLLIPILFRVFVCFRERLFGQRVLKSCLLLLSSWDILGLHYLPKSTQNGSSPEKHSVIPVYSEIYERTYWKGRDCINKEHIYYFLVNHLLLLLYIINVFWTYGGF